MKLGTVTVFRDDALQPYAELVLRNGERIHLRLGAEGLVISGAERAGARDVLFQADAGMTSRICVGLRSPGASQAPTPLRILVSALVQLGSAKDVARAFEDAARDLR